MLASFLITLREGLEAALIVGIVLSLLKKLEKSNRNKPVWLGVGVAVLVSIIVGLLLNALGVSFEGRGEKVFEGIATLVAAGVLTWMIFWMQKQSRNIQTELEADVQQAVTNNNGWAL
ncbi:MAG: FTR1 family protein, partial [Anaerolineae bacterium]|nr:FTR1 family protein [Anaerolineae bacterium]